LTPARSVSLPADSSGEIVGLGLTEEEWEA
jgi:hypothetical protein